MLEFSTEELELIDYAAYSLACDYRENCNEKKVSMANALHYDRKSREFSALRNKVSVELARLSKARNQPCACHQSEIRPSEPCSDTVDVCLTLVFQGTRLQPDSSPEGSPE